MSEYNPFAVPGEPSTSDGDAAPLHDNVNAFVATLLGSVLGGAWIIYENERALGGNGSATLLQGVAASIGLGILVVVVPEEVPSVAFAIATVFGCQAWMEAVQGKRVRTALAGGTRRRERGRAIWLGLVLLFPTVLLVILAGIPLVLLLDL